MDNEEELTNARLDGLDLGRWLGRREAFSVVAGRCSAAEADSLRRIRNDKLYLQCAGTWNEFCEKELGASRRNINRVIGYLEEFGPQYFHIVQMTGISPKEYRAIAGHMDPAGLLLEDQVIELLPENRQKVTGAVTKLLESAEPPASPKKPEFEKAVKRCESAAKLLEGSDYSPDTVEQRALAAALKRLRAAGKRFGIPFDR